MKPVETLIRYLITIDKLLSSQSAIPTQELLCYVNNKERTFLFEGAHSYPRASSMFGSCRYIVSMMQMLHDEPKWQKNQ